LLSLFYLPEDVVQRFNNAMNCREMFRQSSEKETKVQTQARKPNKEMVEGAVLGTRPIFLMLCVCLLELFRAI